MLKTEWGVESNRSYPIPGKTAALVPEFAVEDLPSAELPPGFLCLQRRTWPCAEHCDDDDDDDDDDDGDDDDDDLWTERDGSTVTRGTCIREVPGSIPGADRSDYGFFGVSHSHRDECRIEIFHFQLFRTFLPVVLNVCVA